MWSLDAPLNLLWAVPLPFLIYFVHFGHRRGARLRFSLREWQGEVFSPGFGFGKATYIISRSLFWAGLMLLMVAGAGPTIVEKERVYLSRGIDIVIALDESPSMSAQDFDPINRFESAREVVRRFVEERENDQIGLVSFGSEAALRVPPTVDYGKLLETLDSLQIMELGDGTAIGMGIAISALHLRSSRAAEKVIILLSDGDNNAGEITPETAAEVANGLGIRIHTIGIGQEGDTYLEFSDPKTNKIYKGLYRGRFDEGLLKRVASMSGGRYFYAGSPGTLSAIFDEIDTAERREVRDRWKVTRYPAYHVLVIVGLIFLACDFFVRKGLLQELF